MKAKTPKAADRFDPWKLTCPICGKPMGKSETVIFHMDCCS